MTMEVAVAILAVSAPLTAAVLKFFPHRAKRPASDTWEAKLAYISATLKHLESDVAEIKRDIRVLRSP